MSLRAIAQTQLRKHVASMAWGARNLISTQVRLIMPTSTRSAARCTAWPSPRARRGWSKFSGVSPCFCCFGAGTSWRSTWLGVAIHRRRARAALGPRLGADSILRRFEGYLWSPGTSPPLARHVSARARVDKPTNFLPEMQPSACFTPAPRAAFTELQLPAPRPACATPAPPRPRGSHGRCPRRTGTSPPAAQ